MPPLLNQIWTPRHGEFLRRVFNIRGPSPSPQIAPEIQPVVIVHGSAIADEPELAILHGTFPFIALINAPAVVGNFSFASLNVLPGQNWIVVIQEVMARTSIGALQVQQGNQGGAGGGTIAFRDQRQLNVAGLTVPALQAATGSNAALPGNLCHDLPANVPISCNVILFSSIAALNTGSTITVWGQTAVNTSVQASFIGYIRRPEKTEEFGT